MTAQTVARGIPDLLQALQSRNPALQLRVLAPMAQYTTLRLGGPADLLAEPANTEELRLLLRESRRFPVPVTVIGQGSNLLVRDGGIRGLVIRIARGLRGMYTEGTRVISAAGESMRAVAAAAARSGLSGLAFAAGIPGAVGGGVFMNAGAYGGELKQVISSVRALNRDGAELSLSKEALAFGYRSSALQGMDVIVISAAFDLMPGHQEEIEAEMAELNRKREEKQPVDVPSAGSTFKRPEGHYAAALIASCGLKGFAVGGAQVSEKHAGFLINRGGSAADYLALMVHVQRVVQEQTGVFLTPEVRILGEDAPGVRA